MLRRVVGQSMLPSFRAGMLVFGLRRRPRVGDVVIAKRGELEVIKRVQQISPKGYFVVGDNPVASTDSRTWGWLSSSQIKSVVVGRIGR